MVQFGVLEMGGRFIFVVIKWLPDMFSSRVISPQKNLSINARVCVLIDEDGHCWDEGRVFAKFFPYEAQVILGIPLSSRQVPDTLIWAGTKSGRYTTKSAYKLLSSSPSVGPSNPSAFSKSWNQIWELKVPNKIKHFIWRACRESLPTKKNLFSKKVTRNATCDLCHDGVEDVIHTLWGCQVLKEVWWEEPCLRNQLAMQFVDFRDHGKSEYCSNADIGVDGDWGVFKMRIYKVG